MTQGRLNHTTSFGPFVRSICCHVDIHSLDPIREVSNGHCHVNTQSLDPGATELSSGYCHVDNQSLDPRVAAVSKGYCQVDTRSLDPGATEVGNGCCALPCSYCATSLQNTECFDSVAAYCCCVINFLSACHGCVQCHCWQLGST